MWNQTKHITSPPHQKTYMASTWIYTLNKTGTSELIKKRRAPWQWTPVMEKCTITSNVKLCTDASPGQDCIKTKPCSLAFLPKSTNVRFSTLSALNYVFSKVKYLFSQHSKSNTIWEELYHYSAAQRGNSPHDSKQSTLKKLLWKYREVKHTCHNKFMVPWALSPKKPVSGK